jgi:hypothetical protein
MYVCIYIYIYVAGCGGVNSSDARESAGARKTRLLLLTAFSNREAYSSQGVR